jgi:hypothetical protein
MICRITRLGSSIENLAKLWLISLAGFVLVANGPSMFIDASLWMKNIFIWALTAEVVLVLGLIAVRLYEKRILNHSTTLITDQASSNEKKQKIAKGHFGIIGGLLGICAAGIIMRFAATAANDCPVYLLALSGSLGGLGFVLLTKGDRKVRTTVGCIFAFIAILFSLLLSYTAPVVAAYRLSLDGEPMSPIYWFQNTSFSVYLKQTLFTLSGVFFAYIGFLSVYFGSELTVFRNKAVKSCL